MNPNRLIFTPSEAGALGLPMVERNEGLAVITDGEAPIKMYAERAVPDEAAAAGELYFHIEGDKNEFIARYLTPEEAMAIALVLIRVAKQERERVNGQA